MSDALLVALGVAKSFGGTRALDGVSMVARAGEVHAVLGENGAGKSTLMKVLAGAVRPDAGTMRLAGRAFAPTDPKDARKSGVAIVYQEPQLCPDLSVADNIALGLEPCRVGFVKADEVRERAVQALAQLVDVEQASAVEPGRMVRTLSAGDRQLVAIARALAQADPRVLILDEPTSSLTANDAERLFAAVGRLKTRGMCVIYISHFLEEVERIADGYTVLRDGQSVACGNLADTTIEAIVRLMAGGDVERTPVRRARSAGEPVLELDAITGRKRPNEVSLVLCRGEVLGLAGLVGSGRTELLRAIFGLDAVVSGRVRVGAFVGPASPARRLSQGVGLLSEDRKNEGLAQRMSIADNVTLSRLGDLGPVGMVLPSRQRAAAQHWIDRLGVRCQGASQPVADLSGGNQQKVALARLLHHDVDVLLLDEPTRGIDVRSRAEVHGVIDELRGRGKAVLMVSSHLPELLAVCDRIAVMRRGRLGEPKNASDLSPHDLLMEATGA